MSCVAQPLSSTQGGDPFLGRTIAGKFEIEALLKAGAMGVVYRARHVALDKTVCLKIMHRELAAEPRFVQRFHREARAASRLDHPGSIRVLDFGADFDGTLYIAMEYLDGCDLFELLRDHGPLAPERIVDILSQTLAALATAHDAGVLHRDLKPDNIMVVRSDTDEGTIQERVKVCDFGIAMMISTGEGEAPPDSGRGNRRLTGAGRFIGTPEYMSPEQARAAAVDPRSDVYSVGVLLYQLLTGRLPFEDRTPFLVALKQITEEAEPPSAIDPRVHPGLEAVCLRAMQKDPNRRYPSARAMRAALRGALAAEPVPTDSMLPVDETPSHVRVKRLPTPVTLAAPAPGISLSGSLSGPMVMLAIAALAVAATPWVAAHGTDNLAAAAIAATTPASATPPVATVTPSAVTSTYERTNAPRTPDEAAPPPRPSARAPSATPLAKSEAPASPEAKADAVERVERVDEIAADAPPPVAASAVGAPVPPTADAPLSRYALDSAHVEIGSIHKLSGANPLGFKKALAPAEPKINACYRSALPRIQSSPEGAGILHVETNDVGNIVKARLEGAFQVELGACIARAVIGGRVPNVDTGNATAQVPLHYRPR